MIQRPIRTPIMHRVVEHAGVLRYGGLVAEARSAPMRGQVEQILARIDALLAEMGSDRSKILMATLDITDVALKKAMNAAWTAWFTPETLPSRSTIGVAELRPEVLIEAVMTAARGCGDVPRRSVNIVALRGGREAEQMRGPARNR